MPRDTKPLNDVIRSRTVQKLDAVMRKGAARARAQAEALMHIWDRSSLAKEILKMDRYMEEMKPERGYVLTAEGAAKLAEVRSHRRYLGRQWQRLIQPQQESAEQLTESARLVEKALNRLSSLENESEQLKCLLEQVATLADVWTPAELRVIDLSRAYLKQMEDRAQSDAARAAAEAAEAKTVVDTLREYIPPADELEIAPGGECFIKRIDERDFDTEEQYELNLAAQHLSLVAGFDELLCLPQLGEIEHYPFQINTARQVLRSMRGRALLCDEVGLGKTIEAGLVLKEYLVRGLARKVLVLTPPALVSQWHSEMKEKFGIDFVTHDDPDFRARGERAWSESDRVIASLHSAKNPVNSAAIQEIPYDIIVVDEAHHLKNRTTVNWKFVNGLKSRYLLLLTATPVQNNLDELFNLITLLSPGQLKTASTFRREFVASGDERRPKNRGKLRELLMDVMVRNTRSQVSVALPARHAATLRMNLSPSERALYEAATDYVRREYRGRASERLIAQTLQSEAGSSARALRSTLMAIRQRSGQRNAALEALLEQADGVTAASKADAMLQLLGSRPDKFLIFTRYRETQEFLVESLIRAGIEPATFHGGMSAAAKDQQVATFAESRRVLVSTDVGSEGRNLQFCHSLINYDLPWNPMQIEQRVGRIHRIGQRTPVQIFNLAAHDTIEDYMLEVLDSKINMFELVVGEVGEILGNLEEDREFEDLIMDLWLNAESTEAARAAFDSLGDRILEARRKYLEAREYDTELFAEDFVAEE